MLNERSRRTLTGVHPDLVRVVEAAAARCDVPMVVTEGLRNLERQRALVAAGKSWTLNGRHLTGHAVDIVDADNFAYDIPDMDAIACAMKECAAELKVPLVWGGDWKSKDTPHFELCRRAYPASGVSASTRVAETVSTFGKLRPVVAGAGAAVAVVAEQGVPAVPQKAAESLTNVAGWLDGASKLKGHGGAVWADPILVGVVIVVAAIFLGPKLLEKVRG